MLKFKPSSSKNYLEIIEKNARRHPILFVFDLLLQRKLLFLYIVIGVIIHQSLRFVIAPVIGDLVEFGVEKSNIELVKQYALLIVLLSLLSAFFDMTMSWANEIAANDVEFHTRSIYFRSIQEKSQAFHDSSKIGELMAVAQNDMRSLYSAMAPGIRIMGESFVSLLTISIIIFIESTILGIIFVLILPFWLLALKLYSNRLSPVAIQQQNKFRDLSAEVQENLAASEVVRAFSQEEKEIKNFNKYNQDYTDIWEKRGEVTALYFPMLATYITGGILFLAGSFLAITPVINIGSIHIEQSFGLGGMITLIVLIIQLRGPAMQLNFVLEFWSLGLAGVRKIQKTLATDAELPVKENPINTEIEGRVEFKGVSFAYDNSNLILQDINFKAKKGDIVAIVGSIGSGKSSLLKLLTRLYDVKDGEILIDGVDVRDYDPEVLSSSIGVVEQDVFLFSTSIRENILFAMDEYNEQELNRVVELSRINEFSNYLPEGLETIVGERGVRLSGGQKQRVAIARAFLVNPKILILDDATSAIDGKTEQEIVSALKALMEGRTTFLITNRLNMIRQATRVLILEDGKISGEGTHDELIASNLIYRRIFDPHLELPDLEVD